MSTTPELTRREFVVLACGGALGARSAWAVDFQSPLAELSYAQVKFDAGSLEREARKNHQLVMDLPS